MPANYAMNFDAIIDKPFLVDTYSWSTTNAQFTELDRVPFPSSAVTNPTIEAAFGSSTFYQAKMCALIQVSGTPTHQGLLLAAAIPHGAPPVVNPNQILCAPHVFLNASEATSTCLELPFYSSSTLRRTRLVVDVLPDDGELPTSVFGNDHCDLVLFVMDPLSTSPGAVTTLSVSVHMIFKEPEFYVPRAAAMEWQVQCGSLCSKLKTGVKVRRESTIEGSCDCVYEYSSEANTSFMNSLWRLPTTLLDNAASGLKVVAGDLIDYGRATIKSLTGFHNRNNPFVNTRVIMGFRNFQNNVDTEMHMEKLDNHAMFTRVYDDYYFRTKQDEMDISYLVSKPVYVGKFKVSTATPEGKNLFAYPITPMVEAMATGTEANTTYYSMLRTLYEGSRQWRGGLKLHIQAVCTNFHFTKLLIVKQYATCAGMIHPAAAYVPRYDVVTNMNTDTLEFSAGGQIQTIDLPFCSQFRQLECTKDFVANMISHGVVYGYLVQPLVYNNSVPTSVTFNVYISGAEDLEFSGYATDNVLIPLSTLPSFNAHKTTAADVFEYDIKQLPSKDGPLSVITPAKLESRKKKNEKYQERVKAARQHELLERRKKLWKAKSTFVIPEKYDTWETLSYVTQNTVEQLREMNSETHNSKTPGYSAITGPPLTRNDNIKFSPAWAPYINKDPKVSGLIETDWRPESGVETLVAPSTQKDLLNEEVSYKEPSGIAFRPNTSLREYTRFMYPQTPIVFPSQAEKQYSVAVLRIFDYLTGNNGDCDMLHSIYSSFLGMSGGVKMRINIVGACKAHVVYLPPSSMIANQDNPLLQSCTSYLPIDANSLKMVIEGLDCDVKKQFTLPQIDTVIPSRYSSCTADRRSTPGNCFTFDFEIPNMNACNYVGSAAKYYGLMDYENDLGSLFVVIENAVDYNLGFASSTITPYIGLADETRLGFQCFAMKKTIPTYNPTAPAGSVCRKSPYHGPAVAGGPPGNEARLKIRFL